MKDKVPGDPFLGGIRGQAVGAWEAHHLHPGTVMFVSPDHFIDGHTGIVGHVLTGTCQGIEYSGLSTIWLPGFN